MNLHAPGRADALAAEYVLGTLRGPARARFARLMLTDPLLAEAVRRWEERLIPLAQELPPVTPPARVWETVQKRTGDSGRGSRSAKPRASMWANLGLWRGLALAGLATAFVLAIALFTPAPERPEGTLVVVLAAQDAKPALVASADRTGRILTVKALAPVELAADRALELWALPEGGNPRSLGLISAAGVARVALARPADEVLRNVPTLAVSLEPRGGSPTGLPTGPVLYTGLVQRLY
jgi:anti-sigma-K factor RskA